MQGLGKVDRMEEELKCPICRRLFTNPVLLPCSHSLCLTCAASVQAPASQFQGVGEDTITIPNNISDYDLPVDIDKVSLVSETDSGVVCNSRPNSYVGTPSVGTWIFQSIHGVNALGIVCPVCKKVVLLDEQGASSLPKNRVLENIVDKYGENKHYVVQCQLCEKDTNAATLMCEQCEVFYCDKCREGCHPPRGPLAKHNLVPPDEGKVLLRAKHKSTETKCIEHTEETLSMYCVLCKTTVCYVCCQDGRHINHDVQALGAMCKAQKTEMSQLLQSLSEKARAGTEFIQRLKAMADQVQENCCQFEAGVIAQCDALVAAVQRRRQQLLSQLQQERAHKQRILRDQAAHCTARLQRTTGLLQFSIEALKESDPSAYLQVSGALLGRVGAQERAIGDELDLEPRTAAEFELSLDTHAAQHAVQTLNFYQMKDGSSGKSKCVVRVRIKRRPATQTAGHTKGTLTSPGTPQIMPSECSAENNTVTIAWQPHTASHVDGYVLELDDANEGHFREVYCGKEMMCTVEGLHFDSMYNARVKAFNHAGDSPYSDRVCLQTAEVAWFSLDTSIAHPDCLFSNANLSCTSTSTEDRVALADVGFSKGVHYWEVHVDRYDNQPDPAFGVARFDVDKDTMLGKDDKGWSMYIDYTRSWFIHDAQHTGRTDGGLGVGSVVGVLLDLNQHTLSFSLNGEPHGPVAFTGLHGVFYPAISVNRHVQLTLHTGLEVPLDSDTEDE